MSKTLEGMARAAYRAQYGAEFDSLRDGVREQFMKVALLYLADNVSDEMVEAGLTAKRGLQVNHHATDQRVYLAKQIAAALRAAAGGGEK